MKVKRVIPILAVTLLLLAGVGVLFLGGGPGEPESGKIKIIATIYPLSYYAEQIGGDRVEVTQLIPNNSEVHSWQPSISDIVAAEEADIILSNGAGLDHWLEDDILPSIDMEGKTLVETTEGAELITLEGQAIDDEHGHAVLDPHTWISPYMAQHQAGKVYEALAEYDSANNEYYEERWTSFESELQRLDDQYMTEVAARSARRNKIFTTHTAFGYLAHRYGFEQHGVVGVSADEQPSTATISRILDLMTEEEIYTIYVDPIYAEEYAQTLRSELEERTGEEVQILKLYFMLGPMDGLDYLEQMVANLENLKEGLQ
ncbi:MAG: metal ABC transporter substrate-binding protein [Candidatus Bathyarchaeia archaeon]